MSKSLIKNSLAGGALFIGIMLPISLHANSVSAVELPNGEVAFDRNLCLARATTTFSTKNKPNLLYRLLGVGYARSLRPNLARLQLIVFS